MSFETDESVFLTKENADVSVYDNESVKIIQYVMRKFVKTRLICDDIFWSPFEVINCQIGMKLNKMKLREGAAEVHFNLMDNKEIVKKITTSMDSNFGLFEIASRLLEVKYDTNYLSLEVEEKPKRKWPSLFRDKKKVST